MSERIARGTQRTHHSDRALIVGGVTSIAVIVTALGLSLDQAGYDATVGGVVVLLILLCSVIPLRKFAARAGEPMLFGLLYGALWLKMAFAIVRYFVIFTVYDGLGDSAAYDQAGWQFAQRVRAGDLFPRIDSLENTEDSTRRITKLTGYMYAVIGHSRYAGFFLFSLLAFVGLLLMARGVQMALPEIERRRLYLALLFFPSLLFWPAAIGKDAVMVFLLGVSVLGAGMLLGPKPKATGIVPFGLALAGMLMIRPHVGLMSVMAFGVAIALSVVARSSPGRSSARARFVRVLLLIVVVIGSVAAASSVTRLFADKAGEATSMQDAFNKTLKLTQVGNSKFQPVAVSSPLSLPAAVVSVFIRPFPWEVGNSATAISSVEGLVLAVTLVASHRRIRSIGKLLFQRPLLLFAFAYVMMFTVAFSNIGNFGILARQRTQALPLLVFLIALPARPRVGEGQGADSVSVGPEQPTSVGDVSHVSGASDRSAT